VKWRFLRFNVVRQSQRRQRDARDSDAEFLQCPASRGGLGHVFGQFIELMVHNLCFVFRCGLRIARRNLDPVVDDRAIHDEHVVQRRSIYRVIDGVGSIQQPHGFFLQSQ
jgi:hypothetical protein